MGRPKSNPYREKISPAQKVKGYNIANAYDNGSVVGWPGEDIARQQFYLLMQDPTRSTHFKSLSNLTKQGKGKTFLYHCCRKALGADTKNYRQEIGDCVSFGAKNASEYLVCTQIALGNSLDKFRPVFPPYLYGCGRVFVGHQTDYSDGSVGSWQAEAVQKYGVLAADEPNVPAYAGKVAKAWGGGKGPPQEFVELGKKHPVKSAAKVNSWSDLVAAITNGYPCTVASNQGFQMEAGSDGFHSPHGSWAHQMCIMGVDDSYKTPYALILNSWGDVHGHLKDFDTQEDLPVGVLRVRSDTIERMIKQDDTFAFSHLDWFQDQAIPDDIFHLI
jgi:hypothetical protein